MIRRRALLAAPALLPAAAATAQETWPSRPVRLIVPFAAGGATDIAGRIMAEHLSKLLPQRVVVENRTGAGVVVGSGVVAGAAPDGHTLLYTTIAHSVLRATVANLPFDPDRDFVPVLFVGAVPMLLVGSPDLPAATLAELVALLKSNPGKYNAAYSGRGSATHLGLEMLRDLAGVDFTLVPYRGSGAIQADLAAGRVHLASPVGLALARDGGFKVYAVTTARRARALPEVPAAAETLPGFNAYSWHMLLAPKGTPALLVARINQVFSAALADPETARRLAEQEVELSGGSPADAAQVLAEEGAKWSRIMAAAGVGPQ
jgi:tripartite-type tricarboxylate transporter receptor subunit TctC